MEYNNYRKLILRAGSFLKTLLIVCLLRRNNSVSWNFSDTLNLLGVCSSILKSLFSQTVGITAKGTWNDFAF
jgi:hypothetical protein